VVGLGRDYRDRHDGFRASALDMERLDYGREDQSCFGQRELGSDADPRAEAKGQIGATLGRRRPGQKSRRIEAFRPVPQPPMPVQDPRGDHNDGAGRDYDAVRGIGAARLACESKSGWKKP